MLTTPMPFRRRFAVTTAIFSALFRTRIATWEHETECEHCGIPLFHIYCCKHCAKGGN